MDGQELIEKVKEALIRNGYNSFFDNNTSLVEAREKGKCFSFDEHLEGFIFAQLSNQRPWGTIIDNKENIRNIFMNFDKNKILEMEYMYFIDELKKIKCANRSINSQMKSLKENISMFEQIERDYQSIDNFITKDRPIIIAEILSGGIYKMKQMGIALTMEYLKNVGIDASKPDVHICRILGSDRLGYSKSKVASEREAMEIIKKIAIEGNLKEIEVDALLWQFCAINYGNICGAAPL
jgi:hypothetical protein